MDGERIETSDGQPAYPGGPIRQRPRILLERELAAARAENAQLRAALDKAAGQLGYLSTVLSLSNKTSNAKGAWEWSEDARAALAPAAAGADE